MLINFANENLTKNIVCDKPCFDGHNVTNLISSDPDRRRKGFLVDSFVKPPVFINFEFICNVIINRIVVKCQVGVQKSSSVELFTSQSGCSKKVVVAKKDLLENENTVNFVLHNSNKKYSGCTTTFRLSKYMCNVDGLAIKILRTEGSTLVALGSIEIWGKPSRNVEKNIISEVNDVWRKILAPPSVLKPTETVPDTLKKTIFRYCREIKIPQVEIPEEFIDPITCELFIIPMTLPSGKVVDVSTLERFKQEEAKLGRPPSDPFTGRIFTDSSHPVLANALKARLDKFLLDYSHIPSLKNVPRTVGRRQLTAQPSCSYMNSVSKSVIRQTSPTEKTPIENVDQLLDACLTGLPSFLERPIVRDIKIECIKCKKPTLLFKLTCNDLMCRQCLVSCKNENINSCKNCGKTIDFNSAERFHSAVL